MKALQLFCLFTLIMTASSSYAQDADVVGHYTSRGVQNEIRALIAENEVGVLLATGYYYPDIEELTGNSLQRKVWFCLEQKEIPIFIKFLDNICLTYELLQRSGKPNGYVDGISLPDIGSCMVANFDTQNGFIASRRLKTLKPTFTTDSSNKNRISFDFNFSDDDQELIMCIFTFFSAEEITSLRNTLNNLLPRYLRVN